MEEKHPIPQDITGFQFKLIGEMTIKQFAYLAAGCILGWIFYTLSVPFIVKAPFIVAPVLFAFCLAFIPISGRPMDIMVLNFIRSLFRPTQYVYSKDSGQLVPTVDIKTHENREEPAPAAAQTRGDIPKVFLDKQAHEVSKKPKNKMDEKEMSFFEGLSLLFSGRTSHPTTNVTPHIITASEKGKEKELMEDYMQEAPRDTAKLSDYLEREEEYLKEKLEKAKIAEANPGISPENAHEKVAELQNLLNETAAQKQALEEKLWELQKKLNQEKESPALVPGLAQEAAQPASAPLQQSQNIRQIPQSMGKSVGLPVTTDEPNLVSGIVKDPRGNPLPSILVEIKDIEGNPVRAFKTNGLGQFSAATTLLNGRYTIEFEDPKGEHKFDKIEIEAKGEVILPIEAISTDAREELRKSLFQTGI